MIQAVFDFFFNMISWVFNTFLIKIKLFDIPILYYFLGLMLLSILISFLVNGVKAGVSNSSSGNKKN